MSDAATAELLDQINVAWERSELPAEWKEAEVRFISKPGKPLTIENMLPISLTSCVGKVVECMVLQRLQGFLDETNQTSATMYGFRQHLCTQEVLLQLNELHGSVLENLRKTGCGRRTYGYVENFLTKRTATIRIGEEWSEPMELGDRGTPQGSVLSPLLFNLALLPLPRLLQEIEGRVVTTVYEYSKTCGLSCAPHKSELLMVEPGRPKKEPPPNVIVTIDGTKIEPTQQVCILGLLLCDDGKATAATHTFKTISEQISSMIRSVTNRNLGIKEDDALKLVQVFIVSRITYSAPYLQLTKADREALYTVLRKVTKLTVGVPVHSSTQKLLGLGRHNTVDEMVEGPPLYPKDQTKSDRTRTGLP
ncbi:uncharacterized protein LOC144179776 [Haemaphysalis longicornis]